MRVNVRRWSTVGVFGTLVAGAAILGPAQTASAGDDAGVRNFFTSMFSGGGQSEPAPAPAPAVAPRAADAPHSASPYSRSSAREARSSGRMLRHPAASVEHARLEHPSESRPLTVLLHRPKVSKSQVAQISGRPGKITIFEDRTLRRGDAVMTAKGIRIFAGSKSWPYQESDFVALSDAGHLDKDYQKVLLDLDRMPRS